MRYWIVIVTFVLFWIMLISRIYQISIKSNYYYENLAHNNIERKYFIKPVRGEILDRKGELMAVNKIGFSIKIAPHLQKKGGNLMLCLSLLSKSFLIRIKQNY